KRLDLCRRIKTEYEHVDTMILHISETEILGTEHDMGWDGYLVEPVGQGELLASVRSLLRLRERQRERRGLLEKLRRSEEQFRGLFEQAAVGMCVIGPEGGFLRVNDKLCSIVGRPVDDLMKCELRDLTHPDDRVEHERRVRKLLLGGISEVSLEQRLLRPDGGTVWVTVTLSIQWDAGGRIQSLIGVVEDIEARKQGEVELRNYALRQQLLSEAMDKLLRTDDPSTVIQDIFNSLAPSLSLDAFLDYDVAENCEGILLKSWSGVPDAELAPLSFLRYGQALCGTSAESRRPVIVERLHESTDPKAERMKAVGSRSYACFPLIVGQRLLGTLAFASSRRVSFDPDELEILETVSGYVAMAKERRRLLQETRRHAARLAESEERFRLAVEGASIGTWDVDLETGRMIWNRHNFLLLGYKPDGSRASGKQWWALVHEDDRDRVREAVREARRSGGMYHAEHRIRRADTHALRWLAPYGRIHYDSAGRPARFVGVTFDISERKQAESQLQEWANELERRVSERTKELVRTHDRLRGLAQELTLTEQRERQRLAAELHDYLAQLLVVIRLRLVQASQMIPPGPSRVVLKDADELMDRCLTYTRTLVAELMPPTLREFGLAAGIRWLAESMAKQGLYVDVDLPVVSPPMSEDHTRLLYQCVRELLFNVLKHSGAKHASVTMMENEHKQLSIMVRDEGGGCDPAGVMEAKEGKFGLFSIRERMEAIGGWMEIQSQLGSGTTVILGVGIVVGEFRADPPENRSPEAPSAVTILETSVDALERKPIRVLLVDDHAMVRQGLRSVLDGYSNLDVIAEAGDGEEAVTLASLLRPDLIVMDVSLPRLDGIEATKRIRKDRPETVVVGLSVNQTDHVMRAMMGAGAAAFLTKESAADQLYETIESAVAAK
ncbi:MAG TPA: PAS domain S-box protein, partial [Nitrospiraceae bacterium]